MNIKLSLYGTAALLLFLTACSDDNFNEPNNPGNPGNPGEPAPAVINFTTNSIVVNETETADIEVLLPFSSATTGEGSIQLVVQSMESTYGVYFTTQPEMVDGILTLPVQAGQTQASFKIKALNNDLLNGHKEVLFRVTNATGSVQKGAILGQLLNLIDDELVAKPKSYETFAGDYVKKEYEYDTRGRIARVHWETRTPFKQTGTDTYYYNDEDQLVKINEHPGIDRHFIWSDGRIVRSETNNHGSVSRYEEYFYDDHGNIAAMTIHNKQNTGEFKLTMVIDYLYFLDGNIYKSIASVPIEGSNDFNTIMTKTFDGYIDGSNEFPMIEILPTVKSQSKLPTYYRHEESGFDFEYQISYQFGSNGKVVSRRAHDGVGSQNTQYQYY